MFEKSGRSLSTRQKGIGLLPMLSHAEWSVCSHLQVEVWRWSSSPLSVALPCLGCHKWVLFNFFSLWAWKVLPFQTCLLAGVLQLGPALISCNYKRIPVVTQSYSRLKELPLQRDVSKPLLRATAHSLLMCGQGFWQKNFILIQCG